MSRHYKEIVIDAMDCFVLDHKHLRKVLAKADDKGLPDNWLDLVLTVDSEIDLSDD